MTRVIVIGAGLGGLSAAIRLAQGGASVTLLTFGLGGIQLGQGTIDVLGYTNRTDPAIGRPFDALPSFAAAHPGHPYNRLDAGRVHTAVDWLARLVPDVLLPGDESNWLVPTALGAMRPTYLIQRSMVWPDTARIAVVGPRQIKDFYPTLVAANLEKTAEVRANAYHLDLPARAGEADSSPVVYAKALDDPAFLARFADAVARLIGDEPAICLPAILGFATPAWEQLSDKLGRGVVEALMVPPSIPGMRLNEALTRIAKAAGVRIITGSKVTGFEAAGGRVTAVILRQAGYDKAYAGDGFVYAPGGFESGALAMDSYGQVTETLFGLPLAGLEGELVTADFWADQALFAAGVAVDSAMRPTDAEGGIAYENLHAVGGLLAGAHRWTEMSGDAIAVASGVVAADHLLGREGASDA